MKRILHYLAAVLLIVIASCQKAPELTLSGLTTMEVSADGDSGTITFTTNRDWSTSWSASWVSVSPSSGSASDGPVTVTVRCEPNTTYDPRSATVTISAEGLTQTVTVNQPANEGIIVNGNQSYTLSSAAQTFEVEVQSNIQYEVSTDADWISHVSTKGLRTNRLAFSVKENATYDDRSATVTIRQQGGSLTQTLSVKQVAKDGLLVDTDTFTMSWKGGTLEVEAQANVEFDVTPNADWIHYVQTKALATRRVVLTIDENAAYNSRSGKVTIRQKDGAITRTVTVNQGERDGLEVDTDIYEMSQKGGTLEVKARANVEFDVTPDADWIHYVQTKALSNRTVVLTIDENQNYSTRSGRVTLVQKNGPLSQAVTVRQAGKIAVESISLDKTSLVLKVGETATLTATVSPDNATDRTVTWTSSNPSVATVDGSGKVTAVEGGSSTITAKAGDKSASCTVEITVDVDSVTLDKTSLVLKVGETATLTATVSPDNATDRTVTWTSSNPSVATVDGSGKVTAVKEGSATITAKAGDKSTSCVVIVINQNDDISVNAIALKYYNCGVHSDHVDICLIADNRFSDETGFGTGPLRQNWASARAIISGVSYNLPATDGASLVNYSKLGKYYWDWAFRNQTVRLALMKASKTPVAIIMKDVRGGVYVLVFNEDQGLPGRDYAYEWGAGSDHGGSGGVPVPDAVDLGLSVKWASFNLGASKPEEYGDYYAWGETETKSDYSWKTYKWANGSEKKLTKYCNETSYWAGSGSPDNKLQLDPEDDVAHVRLGGKWRMPTSTEWTELKNKCIWTETALNNISVRKVTGPNGNSIFLPAAGYRHNTGLSLDDAGSYCYYWSSSLLEDRSDFARLVGFGPRTFYWYGSRDYGYSVRPVTE